MHINNIKELFNLKGVLIKKIENFDDFFEIHIEMPKKEHICPCCNTTTSKIHDYRIQIIKDSPLNSKKIFLHYKKRRYVCKNCGKKFYEDNNFVRPKFRTTNSLLAYVIDELKKMKTIKSIAEDCGVSSNYIFRLLPYLCAPSRKLPRVLCIDEFKGNTGGFKYNVILLDGETHKIFDIVKCRHQHFLADYFKQFPKEERDNVKFFVSDMYSVYRNLAFTYFQNAKTIVDRFHFTRWAVKVVDDLRKEIQNKLPPSERKFFKYSRRLLLGRQCNIKTEQDLDYLKYMLNNFSENLRTAYREKEALLDIIHSDESSDIKIKKFNEWVNRNSSSPVPELRECSKTFSNWAQGIRNSLAYDFSNGPTEGTNTKIKTYKRICFGLRNFNNFKTRLLLLT